MAPIQRLVRVNKLSALLKLNCLKESLKGTAAHLLKNTALVANNCKRCGTPWFPHTRISANSALLVSNVIKAND